MSTPTPIDASNFQTVIGLEIHVQLKTESKLFSPAPNRFSHNANTQVNVIDLGMPGVLPVINQQVVVCAVRLGLALGASIHPASVFARKHYFYPDLPKGYQISQLEDPIVHDGHIDIIGDDGTSRRIDIERAHLEEDAGKLVHQSNHTSGVDFNRSGVPLLEVVTAPQMHSAAEAARLMKQLHRLVRYLGICSGNLEEGAFRCDANVSLRPDASAPLGTRTELKNINSFRFVEKAINYEISRQRECLESGQKLIQETRLYDSQKDRTYSMRSKEDAQDYRYFPDPDLLSVRIDDDFIADIKAQMPRLPAERESIWCERHGVSAENAHRLSADVDCADYFDALIAHAPEYANEGAGWIVQEILPRLEAGDDSDMSHCPVSADDLAAILNKLAEQTLTTPMARKLFDLLWNGGSDVEALIQEHQLNPISDQTELAAMVDELFERSPDQVAQLRAGKQKLMGFFVGQVMKKTAGRADPKQVDQMVRARLDLPSTDS